MVVRSRRNRWRCPNEKADAQDESRSASGGRRSSTCDARSIVNRQETVAVIEESKFALAVKLKLIRWKKLTNKFQARRARERSERLASYGLTHDDQSRLAKLAAVQREVLASDPKAQDALARQAQTVATQGGIPSLPPSRIGSRELSLIVKTDGTMVSQYGPCTCGAAKRQWHAVH